MSFLFVYVYDKVGMPVTSRLMAFFIFFCSGFMGIFTIGWVWNMLAVKLCAPIVVISFVGMIFWMRSLAKLARKAQTLSQGENKNG
jgi:cytosine/uracil/thiamine/allantoin permease